MKNLESRSLGNLCNDIVLRLAGDKYIDFVRLYMAWRIVVGDLLYEKSKPSKYENGILLVSVQNNTWMQELVILKPKILQALSKETGIAIQDIIFVIRNRKR